MDKKNILVFPCGSEIGLEIYRSLKYSRFINLYGGNSVDDHGKFIFENYVNGIPFVDEPNFIPCIRQIVEEYKIDAIFPTMDSVITKLGKNQDLLNCIVIGSSIWTTAICLSKKRTYEVLGKLVKVPRIYTNLDEIEEFPVFMKPEIGYGSRGACIIKDKSQAEIHLKEFPNSIILEYLPGKEYTVDCFTNRKRELLFVGPRLRKRIRTGISVNTISIEKDIKRFQEIANQINRILELRGAWFFQVKENWQGELVLLEVACRLGGSSGLYRSKGINFALLSIFDSFVDEVKILENNFLIEMDRALDSKYIIGLNFDKAYIDYDDCLVINDKLNVQLISLIYQFINEKIKIIILTKYQQGDIYRMLRLHRIESLFDEVICINKSDNKFRYIDPNKSIFIDDSFKERKEVFDMLKIPVFAPDAVECLIK